LFNHYVVVHITWLGNHHNLLVNAQSPKIICHR